MSRKKIVAATMTAAALGLAFAGYTATRANGSEELPHARSLPLKADAGYRQNHQIGHNGAVFEWMDAATSLDHAMNTRGHEELPVLGKDLVADLGEEDELAPVITRHTDRVGADSYGFGLASGGGGGTPKGAGEWGGGRYAGNFGGFGGIASFGGGGSGGGGTVNTKGASGTNDVSGDKPHQDTPATSNTDTGQPGSADPKAGDPSTTGPTDLTPGEQNKGPDPEQNPDSTSGLPGGDDHAPGNPHPHDPPTHSVPEPATLGLLGFGIIAAGALRRRRRS